MTVYGWTAHPRLWFRRIGLAFAVVIVLSEVLSPSSATASELQFNLGVEGGLSASHAPSKKGGHIALRTSLVELHWIHGLGNSMYPKGWLGAYGRLELNGQDSRAVFGVGHSLPVGVGIMGVESGLVFARDEAGQLGGGAEITGFFTLGIGALYVRESYVHTESGRWQTDVGLRLLLPLSLSR